MEKNTIPDRSYDFLLTGGAGFIGSHLCESLLESGSSVLVLDDLSTGALSNLESCEGSPSFDFVPGSILEDDLVSRCVERSGTVVHLAAAVGVEQIIRKPVDTIEINVRGTENVLRASSEFSRRTFIASTSEVYGKSQDAPFDEEGDIVLGATSRSRWSYACSKAVDEFLAMAYSKDRDLEIVIGRLFNTVGPRQTGRYGMVLPRFVDQALEGRPVTVYGDGLQTRCFSLVDEVVRCIVNVLSTPEATGKAVNIGSTAEITILELARRVVDITGSGSEIIKVPYDEAYPRDFEDMRRRVPDITRLVELTGYAPSAGIDEIIRSVVDWKRSL